MKRLTIILFLTLVAVPAHAEKAPASAPAVAKVAPSVTPAKTVTPAKAAPVKVAEKAAAPKAAAPKVQSWWQALVFDLLKLVLSVLMLPLCYLVFSLLRKWGLKVELSRIESIGRMAADFAEKKGAEWLNEHGKKSSGAQKADWAFEFALALDKKFGATKALQEKLVKVITANIAPAEEKAAAAAAAKADAETAKIEKEAVEAESKGEAS